MKPSEAKVQFIAEAIKQGFTEQQAAFLFEKFWEQRVEMECMESRLEARG